MDQMFCSVCGMEVFKAANFDAYFHDVWPRAIDTRAISVTDHRGTVITLGDVL